MFVSMLVGGVEWWTSSGKSRSRRGGDESGGEKTHKGEGHGGVCERVIYG